MSTKGLKPAISRPSARDALRAVQAVAEEVGLPPAAMPARSRPPPSQGDAADDDGSALVQLNVRVRRDLGDQLADSARAEGTTQKVIVCRALAAAGFAVHPDDLRATAPPRRRGTAAGSS